MTYVWLALIVMAFVLGRMSVKRPNTSGIV